MSGKLIELLKKRKILIYPAGMNGQLIQSTLKIGNIDVEYFVDRAFESLKNINGVPVKSVDTLKDLDDQHVVIISTNLKTQYDFFQKQVNDLNKNIQIIDGKNLNRDLRMPICEARLKNNEIFDLIKCEHCGFEREHCDVASRYLKKVSKHTEMHTDYRSTKFDWFGYIVSQNCTLKCEHCCELVPYQKNKSFSSVEEIVKDVRTLAKSSKFIKFVELVGGEPLLHPEIEKLLTELLKIENIGYIKSFTNATVIPSDELCEIMSHHRFMLHISNYELVATGKLLENIHKTRKKLDDFGIQYIFAKNFEWLDFTSFKKHEASDEYLKNAFDQCFLKNCNRVYKGKLYRCPHHYSGVQLQALQELPIECVDIHSFDRKSLAVALENFESVDFIDACRYCDLAFDAKIVPAGLQLKEGIK